MVQPPRCPNRACPEHHHPTPRFYVRTGFYRPRCRSHPVPRFRCRTCERGFSRQTFRVDYRDHRPSLNDPLVRLLALPLRNGQLQRSQHRLLCKGVRQLDERRVEADRIRHDSTSTRRRNAACRAERSGGTTGLTPEMPGHPIAPKAPLERYKFRPGAPSEVNVCFLNG